MRRAGRRQPAPMNATPSSDQKKSGMCSIDITMVSDRGRSGSGSRFRNMSPIAASGMSARSTGRPSGRVARK